MMQHYTIRFRLQVSYGLLILLIVGGGGYTLRSLYLIDRDQEQIANASAEAVRGQKEMQRAQVAEKLALEWAYPVLGENRALLAYVLANSDEVRRALFAEFASHGKKIEQISGQIRDHLASQQELKLVEEIVILQASIREAAINVIAAFDGEAEYGEYTQQEMAQFTRLVNELLASIAQFSDISRNNVAAYSDKYDAAIAAVNHSVSASQGRVASSTRSNLLVMIGKRLPNPT